MNWEKVPQELYTRLGSSGLQISKIIVGCMSFGTKTWGGDWVLDDENEVFAIMKKAYDEGIRTYDTADTYSNGISERLLGKFIKKYNIDRSKIVILTKVFFPAPEEYETFSVVNMANFPGHELVNRTGLSRKHIMDAAAASVERLGTYIDVLQIHRYDPYTPVEETMEALNDCIKQGLTRYIGASTMRAYQFIKMQNVAEKNGWAKFISMQSYYNLLYREEEQELIAYCNETGVGLIPWSPNAGGFLARPLSTQDTARSSSVFGAMTVALCGLGNMTEAEKTIINRVEELAKKKEVSMASVAVAWVLSKNSWPIIGFSKPGRVDDSLDGFRLKLTEEEIKFLEEPYAPKPLPYLYNMGA